MRIDMHTHAFADKIAAKALAAIMAPLPPQYRTAYDGRLATLIAQLKANGFDRAALCQIATKPAQYGPILEWSQAIRRGDFGEEAARMIVPLPSVHPADPDREARLALEGAPFPQGVAVAGDRAFVVDGLNLWCVDVADVAKMSVVSKTAISDAGETGPRAVVLEPDGKTAYLACGRAGVRAYDVSNPAAPRALWDCPTAFSRDVALFDGGVASAEELSGVALVRDGKLIDKLKLPRDGAVAIRANGKRLFVANGTQLLAVVGFDDDGKLKVVASQGGAARPLFGTYSYFALPVRNAIPFGTSVYVLDGESGIFEVGLDRNGCHVRRSSGRLPYSVTKAAIERDGWLYVSCSWIDGPTRLLAFDLLSNELRPVAEAK